jgi:hypothetical protein
MTATSEMATAIRAIQGQEPEEIIAVMNKRFAGWTMDKLEDAFNIITDGVRGPITRIRRVTTAHWSATNPAAAFGRRRRVLSLRCAIPSNRRGRGSESPETCIARARLGAR